MKYGKQIKPLVFFFLNISFAENLQSPIENVQFQALKSGGFRACIPDHIGLKKFKINANLKEAVPGKLEGEAQIATNGSWVIHFNDTVKVGDVLKYNVHIDSGGLGYRRNDLFWQVAESDLRDSYSSLEPCRPSSTTVNGGKAECAEKLIILDEFDGSSVNRTNWIVQHRIPTYETINAEFNSYEDIDDTRFLKNGILYLRPIALQGENDVRGKLNLRSGCTSNDDKQCYYERQGKFLLPPVKSARITSKVSFKYGKVEIKARLPAGEWIVPVMVLESEENNYVNFSPKILIAYTRGNDHLIGIEEDDIGSRLLYGGPVLVSGKLEQNQHLRKRSVLDDKPYSNDFHVYTLEWLPGKMSLYVDYQLYGNIDTQQGFDVFDKEFLLSLGVAVGGHDDFPDDYISGNNPKPWDYNSPNYVKTFFAARSVWSNTWNGDKSALLIDYVKVWTI